MGEILNWANLIYAIIGILIVGIPLAIKLYNAIKLAIKNKELLPIILGAIAQAEKKMTSPTDRLEFALNIIEESCKNLKVPFNKDEFSKIVNDLVAMSKVVNVVATSKIENVKPKNKIDGKK